MTNLHVQPLFPVADTTRLVRGLYLDEGIQQRGSVETPYIYANYVSSLDGRIAVAKAGHDWHVPQHLTGRIDWILFQELQAHADCLITHSGYMRSLQRKELGNILKIGNADQNRYLHNWRSRNNLTEQPQVVIVSRSLDFVLPASMDARSQSVCVITGPESNVSRQNDLKTRGVSMHVVKEQGLISARDIQTVLKKIGVRNAYLQTGPDLLHSMLQHELLSRIYMTLDLSLLGGNKMLTMVQGELLSRHAQLKLRSLYYYQQHELLEIKSNHSPEISTSCDTEEQLYACFDVV